MNDTVDKAKIATIVRDEIMPSADSGLRQQKKLMPRLETLRSKLKAASDAGDVDLIDFQINEVKEQSDEIKECLGDLDGALAGIRQLQKDYPDLKGSSGALEAVLKNVTAARNSLNDLQVTLKKLEDEANKSRTASAASVKTLVREATAEWSKLEASVKESFRENQASLAKMPAVEALAQKAAAEHDAALLAQARKQNETFFYAAKEFGAQCRRRLADHEKNFERRRLPPDLASQFAREKKEIEGMIAGFEASGAQIDTMKQTIAALEIHTVDGRKAAKELGFPDAAAAEVKKLFDGSNAEVAKGLDALARKYKATPPSAKDAIALLARKGLR